VDLPPRPGQYRPRPGARGPVPRHPYPSCQRTHPSALTAGGREWQPPVTRVLDDDSYCQALLAKLIEEAQEASHASVDDLPGELADVLEVLRALTVTAGMSWPQLLALAEDKRSRRGGFGRRIFLESVK
jgi:predicted house-cleaning noncanonical NTP pyrophosphatase (MazG superfamily)